MVKSGSNTKRKRCKETARCRYWRRMMAAWERSGVTQVEFCRREGLSRAAFAWWRHRFKKAREEENRERTSAGRNGKNARRKMSAKKTQGNGRRNREKKSGEPAPLFIPIEVNSGAVQLKSGVVQGKPGVVEMAGRIVEMRPGEVEDSSGNRIEVILSSGHRLRVPDGFHAETLARLVEILEGSC